ncbi:hypothetical protein UFOVP229_11 [uncultured Caudovirales phage]|uniref:Uncharacterized protein n=1 Tax=uncultured Caudovirales phage TaxID=2100421 RepID=A0A6J7WM67_9CAUD|nr:hypothetical protein UFOVP229_11 [uncultured Caudovirales phage]
MKGFIVEYAVQGFPQIDVQIGVKDPVFDKNQEVLSIWEFDGEEERNAILADLRSFRDQQRKGKA